MLNSLNAEDIIKLFFYTLFFLEFLNFFLSERKFSVIIKMKTRKLHKLRAILETFSKALFLTLHSI